MQECGPGMQGLQFERTRRWPSRRQINAHIGNRAAALQARRRTPDGRNETRANRPAGNATARYVAVLAIAAQAACRPPPAAETTFDSKIMGRPAAPIERLLIIAAEEGAFTGPLLDGFQDALANRLGMCRVVPSILPRDPMALDFDDRVSAVVKQFQPNAILMVRYQGGDLATSDAGVTGKLSFELEILDATSDRQTWLGTSMLDVHVGGDWSIYAEAGSVFATGVVSRLRDDGVLMRCPARGDGWPEIARPPGCLRQRQRIFQEAAKAWDQELRAAKLRTAPSCGLTPAASQDPAR